jgi:hypothetical protein
VKLMIQLIPFTQEVLRYIMISGADIGGMGMKRAIAEYVALCDNCQRVKAECQRPAGLLQPLKIPEWKWKEICMDFIVGLPKTQNGYDSIWVIVDHLSEVAHFIPVKTTYKGSKL